MQCGTSFSPKFCLVMWRLPVCVCVLVYTSSRLILVALQAERHISAHESENTSFG